MLIFGAIVYYLVKFFGKKINNSYKPPGRVSRGENSAGSPPPYDPNNVQDIDYRESSKK